MVDPGLFPALLTLLTVARSGSVGAAARLRHRTSSAVSQQLRRLERHFGVKLVERAGRGVRLTAAAEAALPAIVRLAADADSVFGQLAALAGRPVTTLRVAVSDYLGKALVAPVLRGLLERRAPLRFEVITAHSRDAARLVARGGADLALVSGSDLARGVAEERLFSQPFVWVGPRRGRGGPDLVERLRHEPVVRLAAESQGRRLLDDYLEGEGLHPPSTIDVPSVSLMLAYVSGGLGIGLAPALALVDVAPGRVVSQRASVPALPVVLLRGAGVERDDAAARFAASLAAEGRRAGRTLRRLRPG
jgi:DNA-binding transcriptional LysR family regulator